MYLLVQSSNRNTRIRCEICSKLIVKHQKEAKDVVLVFLLTSNICRTLFNVSIVNFEHVITGWVWVALFVSSTGAVG